MHKLEMRPRVPGRGFEAFRGGILREEREMEMDGKYGMILKRYCRNNVAKFIIIYYNLLYIPQYYTRDKRG